MTQATLQTTRLLLEPLAPEHLEHEVALDTDPQVMRYLFNGRPRARTDIVWSHNRRLQMAKEHPGLGFWVGFLDGAFVGWWLLEPVLEPAVMAETTRPAPTGSSAEPTSPAGPTSDADPARLPVQASHHRVRAPRPDQHLPRPGEAEIGYRLLPRFWRQGLATEGSLALMRHAFTDLALHRVIAQTMAVNEASRATMARIGLRYVRTFHEEWDEPIPGAEHGEVEYAATREDWLPAHPR